ncbi:MAG: anthranilate synthase component I [Candidatus Omnitrophica bacterium]|nr:anthranilate synthase component I [Candidatus Omnitrophota bacterium]
MEIYPSQKEFLKLSQKGNLIPVYAEILGDLETPVSAYFKTCQKAKYSFLLESVEGEEKVARFSFLAKDPELILRTKGKKAIITYGKTGKSEEKTFKHNPLELVEEVLSAYRFVNIPELPMFCGGMVGFMSYDAVRFFEKLPQKTIDDLNLPDTIFVLTKDFVVFDHRSHRIKVINCVEINENDSLKGKISKYNKCIASIKNSLNDLNKTFVLPKRAKRKKDFKVESNFTKEEFEGIIRRAKKEIQSGEIIQVVLSQRFKVELNTEAINIYRALRALNPSPYMYFLSFDDVKIIGSSPEMLVRYEGGTVETRPIAGTRKRGKDEKEDKLLAEDLLNDPKEKAEHIMLVDLGRNDLGRVCKKGTVKVSEFMKTEKYSHVMHIVSNVKGELSSNKTAYDCLRAAFPAGTVSGAPKIRAMEIIEDLEKTSRGPYAGCVGYFSFTGSLNSCITIRTIVVKDEKAYIQAGAGIVADSIPQKEYKETVNKAKAQIQALELAGCQ